MATDDVDTLCQQAQQAVAAGKNEQARSLYLQALRLRSDLPGVHYGLATVCYLLRDLDMAAYHFKEVTRLDPRRASAYINLGAVYNKLDKLEDAAKVLRRGIQIDMKKGEGYYNLGLVYRRMGKNELALQAYQEATRVNPRLTDAHYNLGNLYFEREQFALAVKHYNQALELRPDWEKAKRGLEKARGMMQESETIFDNPTTPMAEDDPHESTHQVIDPERTVDPEVHGKHLTLMHQGTIQTEELSQELVLLLHAEVEPIIKSISNALLQPTAKGGNLEQSLSKLQEAMEHLRSVRENIREQMSQVHQQGDRMLRK
ncbi:MAG: tetratricopeptide repeat protein [Gemmataceae bacterium]